MATTTEPVASVGIVASPRLAFRNAAKAIEFYQNAFGAKETFRFENEFGIGHAEIMIGDTVIMVANEWPEGGRYSPETTGSSAVGMALRVPDVDGFVEHAADHRREPQELERLLAEALHTPLDHLPHALGQRDRTRAVDAPAPTVLVEDERPGLPKATQDLPHEERVATGLGRDLLRQLKDVLVELVPGGGRHDLGHLV